MGRKIPGRKHRGVRDVEKQRQTRLDKIKDKVDAPPIDKNEQEVPKSLTRLIELRDKVKKGDINKKTKPKSSNKGKPVVFKPLKAGMNPESGHVYAQLDGENDRAFIQRINKVVRDVIKENSFENKYNVNIKRNQTTGEVEEVLKKDKDPLELFMEQLKKEKKLKGNKKKKKLAEAKAQKAQNDQKTSKTQKKLKKKVLKKQLKENDLLEDKLEVQHEHVEFGEVAHAPPTLVAPKKVAKSLNAPRPGSKDLLLKSLYKKNKEPRKEPKTTHEKSKKVASEHPKAPKKEKKTPKVEQKVIDKKGKRKDLPAALRRQLDKQQTEIIKAYKELKQQKYVK